jgi:hypothetical protein
MRGAAMRGAAMIEGIIVISTMLVFMGLITYTRQSYGKKMDLQQQTRANTLFFASNGCEGATTGGGSVPAGGGNEAANAANKSNVPNKAAASRKFNTASTSASDSASFQAVWDNNANGGNATIEYGKHTLSRQISAASKVTCNEKKYKNQWTAWLQFGIDFVSRGFGGVGDLFN